MPTGPQPLNALSEGLSFNIFQKGNSNCPEALGEATATHDKACERGPNLHNSQCWCHLSSFSSPEQKSCGMRSHGLLYKHVWMFRT